MFLWCNRPPVPRRAKSPPVLEPVENRLRSTAYPVKPHWSWIHTRSVPNEEPSARRSPSTLSPSSFPACLATRGGPWAAFGREVGSSRCCPHHILIEGFRMADSCVLSTSSAPTSFGSSTVMFRYSAPRSTTGESVVLSLNVEG